MAGVSLGGLSSGLDTQSIIDQLMAIDRAPETRMKLQQSALQARQQTLTDIGTRLRNLAEHGQGPRVHRDLGEHADARGLRQHEAERDAPQRRGARRPRDRGHLARALRAAQLRLHGERLDAHDRLARTSRSAPRTTATPPPTRSTRTPTRPSTPSSSRTRSATRRRTGSSSPARTRARSTSTDMAVSGADWTSTETYTAGVNAKFTVDGGAAAGEQEQRRQERRPRPPAHVQEHRARRRSP